MFLFHIMGFDEIQRVTTRTYLRGQRGSLKWRGPHGVRRLPHEHKPSHCRSIRQARRLAALEFAVSVGQRHILRCVFCTRFGLCDVRSTRGFLDGRARLGLDLLSDHLGLCTLGEPLGEANDVAIDYRARGLRSYFFSGVRRMPTGS